MKTFVAVTAFILFVSNAFTAELSWMYVQHRRYENGRILNRLVFGLVDEKGHNLTDGNSVVDVKLYAPGGDPVKLSKYKFDSDEEIFGLYDAVKSQWFYSDTWQFDSWFRADFSDRVAQGDFVTLAPSKTKDEVGELIHSFNTMVLQLEERIRLKEAMNLAMEVQQNLLPQKPLQLKNMDIIGKSIYCDETGGDYFDFFQFSALGPGNVGIAVGDVVGHGISAALLMTTARAFLRSQMAQPGNLDQKVAAVSRLLCMDTFESCDFMTLFLMVIDSNKRELRWVRAGHDPAMVYDPSSRSFNELNGRGSALGVSMPTGRFKSVNTQGGLKDRLSSLVRTEFGKQKTPKRKNLANFDYVKLSVNIVNSQRKKF